MAIQFENPWLLFLIFPVALFMYFTAKNMIRFKRWRRISIILARSLGFLLVILLLSGFAFHHISVKTTTLFLADSSDSVIHKEEETDFIREAAKGMGRNDEAGVINFGGDSAIELLPGGSFLFDGMQTKITPSFTNLENALVTARSIMPWDHKKRVVLLTDGRGRRAASDQTNEGEGVCYRYLSRKLGLSERGPAPGAEDPGFG